MKPWLDETPPSMMDSARAHLMGGIVAAIVAACAWSFVAPNLVTVTLAVLACLLVLYAVLSALRNHPRAETISAAIFVSVTLVLIGWTAFNHEQYVRHHLPHEPFLGIKVIALFLPLFCPPKRWVARVTLPLLAVAAVIQFFSWPQEVRMQAGVQEPWATVAFVILSGITYRFRLNFAELRLAQRVTAERNLLLQRIAHVLMGTKHLMNTPLQTLEVALDVIRKERPLAADLSTSIENSFESIRRIATTLSFADPHVTWESYELPANVTELNLQIEKILHRSQAAKEASPPTTNRSMFFV